MDINLTGMASDAQVFSKIQDTYLDERGSPFFNWVYKLFGRLVALLSPRS